MKVLQIHKKVIHNAIVEMKKACGDGATRAVFGGPNEVKAMEKLLGAGEFQAIAAQCLWVASTEAEQKEGW